MLFSPVGVLTVPRHHSSEVSLDTYWVLVMYSYYAYVHFCADPGATDLVDY